MNQVKTLSPWCRRMKATMAYNGISVTQLAQMIGRSRTWTSLALNGAVVSDDMIQRIEDTVAKSNDALFGQEKGVDIHSEISDCSLGDW